MPDEPDDLTHKRQRVHTNDVQNMPKRPCRDSLCHGSLSEHPCKDDLHVDYFISDKLVDPVPEEEIILGVMKRLEEEMNESQSDESCSSCDGLHESIQKAESVPDSSTCSVIGRNWNSASDACSSRVDIEYLMGVSDDELGLPPSPHSLEGNDDMFVNLELEPEVEELLQQYTADCWAEQSVDWVPYDIKGIESPPGAL